jgi:hypothetical protein
MEIEGNLGERYWERVAWEAFGAMTFGILVLG